MCVCAHTEIYAGILIMKRGKFIVVLNWMTNDYLKLLATKESLGLVCKILQAITTGEK